MINALEHNSNNLNIDTIGRIINSLSLKEITGNVKIFLQFIEENKSERINLCRTLARTILEYTQVHHLNHMISPKSKNVIILSQEESPLYLLRTYIGGQKRVGKIVSGLKEFLIHCEDFIEPTGIDITIRQIELVINIVQRKFSLIDIIAPVNPLVIMLE